MIRNIYRFLPVILSMFLVLILFSSCERDTFEIINKERVLPEIRGKRVRIQDLMAQPRLASKLTALSTTGIAKSTNLAGIQIDTTGIRAIETDNYISYTFKIVQDSVEKQSVLKNYILTIVNDTLEIQHLVFYNVISPTVYDMQNIQAEQVYGDDLRSQFSKCTGLPVFTQGEVCVQYRCGSNDHGVGENCNLEESQKPYETCFNAWIEDEGPSACGSGTAGGDAGVADNGGGGSGNGNNNNQGYDPAIIGLSPNDGIFLEPIRLPVRVSQLTENLFNSLSQSLQDFINDTAQNELRSAIDTYLLDELHDASAKGFAQEVIKAKEDSEDAEVDYDNKLIYNENVPDCLKGIINKLKPTEGFNVNFAGADPRLMQEMQLSNMILDLFNNDAGYSLTIETGDLPPDSITGLRPNAQTSSPVPSTVPTTNIFNVAISLDNSYLSAATDLAVARTMIHELIHAYFSYLHRSQPQSDIAQQLDVLMRNFTLNQAEHEVMAARFVDSIANALGVWDNLSIPINQSNGIDFDGTPFDYYQLLSWSGQLAETGYYNNKSFQFREFSSSSRNAEVGIIDQNAFTRTLPKGNNNCQ